MAVWFALGVLVWVVLRVVVRAVYTIGPNERAVLTSFGRAQRAADATTAADPAAVALSDDEKQRFAYPQVRVIGPDVSELLPELTLAQLWDLTAHELARNVHAHPTLGEAVKEALHGLAGHMINM